MRFRTKTILGVALIELTLLAILVVSTLEVLRDTNERELVRRAQLGGRMLAAAAKDAVISQDLATLDSLADEVIASGLADYVQILDAAGTVFTKRGEPALLERPFRKDPGIAQVNDGVFDWSSSVMAGGVEYGFITLGVSTEPLSLLLSSTRRWAAGIAGLEILLVAIFSWMLGSYLVRQLVALRDASGRLAGGEFGHRVPVSGRDELTQTALAFNRMAEQIEEINAGLEQQVAERTAELNAANAHLRIAAATFETQDPIMITDAQAGIVRVNLAFTEVTGFSEDEVLGKNPSIMKSGHHDNAFFEDMWRQLIDHGAWTGEVWDRRKNGQVYPKWLTITAVRDEAGQVTHYVAIFSDITARKEAEEEVHNLAFYDPLTRLPNRRLFLDRFRAALAASSRREDYGAVLFTDMDHFKTINDTLGHDHGDLMLIEVAARIKSCIRETDTAARLGGDEFVVLIENAGDNLKDASNRVGFVAEKIRETLARPYLLKGHEHHSSPSIGICLFHDNLIPVETLLQHADMAMYQAKEAGRNTVRFFDPVMQHNVTARAALINGLRRAVAQGQLLLYYQIQVDSERRPLGAEALLRWLHPERGLVMPEEFIPIAEEDGLTLDISQWVLDTACRQLALWADDVGKRDLTLAVNISAKQFGMPEFVEQVAELLRKHRIVPARLKLELTESVAMNDLVGTVKKMQALRALGVKLSMDDFGTGSSSLSYLKQLPLDQLKIDREFVNGIVACSNDALLVRTIINLAGNFGLHVIAEGVETEEQLSFLKNNDCLAYQGFLFSEPLPIEEFEALLADTRDQAQADTPDKKGAHKRSA